MIQVQKNKSSVLYPPQRSKSLINNAIIPHQHQTISQSQYKQSIQNLVGGIDRQNNKGAINKTKSEYKYNPENNADTINNQISQRRHVRLTKRKIKNQQLNRKQQPNNSGETQLQSKTGSCVLQNKERETLNRLVEMSIKNHDPSLCVCAYCTCGRHICKMHVSKPLSCQQLTSYKKDYIIKTPNNNLKIKIPSEFKKRDKQIIPCSTYGKQYFAKQSHLENKFLPENLLHVGGPFDGKTTYVTDFPQYQLKKTDLMRPIDSSVGNCPFNSSTSYQKDYPPKQSERLQQVKTPGNIKFGEPWLGKSTYQDIFTVPSKAYVQKLRSRTLDISDPKYANQYDTVYKNNYTPLKNVVCPAVPEFLTRSKFLSASKGLGAKEQSRKSESLIRAKQ